MGGTFSWWDITISGQLNVSAWAWNSSTLCGAWIGVG